MLSSAVLSFLAERRRRPALMALGAALFLAALWWIVPPGPDGFAPWILSLAAAALAVERLGGPRGADRRTREVAAIGLSLVSGVLFFRGLHAVFSLEKGSYYVAAGLLPTSDANGYMKGARTLVDFGYLDEWSSRRPLGVAFLGVLFKVTGQSFRRALFLQTLLSWACFSAALREVVLGLGLSAAVVFLGVTAGHHALYVGSFMTEPLGFALGALGFALLLRGSAEMDRRAFLAGLLLLGLALAVRAGPTPALPLLALLGARRFRGEGRLDLRMLGAGAAVVTLSLVVSPALLRFIGPLGARLQGNAAYSLYGLAVGGKGWAQVVFDHPEILSVTSDGERSRMVYGLFRAAFARQPSLFFRAIVEGWQRALLSPFATSFDLGLPLRYEVLFVPVVVGVLAIGRSLKKTGDGVFGFALVVLGTTFLFFPILVDAWPRVLAPTVFFHAAVPALGAAAIARAPIRLRAKAEPGHVRHRGLLAPAALSLAAAVVLLPLWVKLTRPDLAGLAAPSCQAGEAPMAFRIGRGSSVTVDAKSREALRQSGLPGLGAPNALPDGAAVTTIVNLLDPSAIDSKYLVITNPRGEAERQGQVVFACTRLQAAGLYWHNVFTARMVDAR